MTVQLVHSRFTSESNWLREVFRGKREAIISVEFSSNSGTRSVEDKRSSPPLTIVGGKEKVLDRSWSIYIANSMPTIDFTSAKVIVSIAISSKDGADDLLSLAGTISETTPGLSFSQAAVGATTASFEVIKFLFDADVVEKKVETTKDLATTGNTTIKPGYYAVLAADEQRLYSEYVKYSGALEWTGSELRMGSQPLNDEVSYVVLRVDYTDRKYQDPANALSSFKPWARKYSEAHSKASDFFDLQAASYARSEVQKLLNEAYTLLKADPDFIWAEKTDIHKALAGVVSERFGEAYRTLQNNDPLSPFIIPTPDARRPLERIEINSEVLERGTEQLEIEN